MRVIAAILLIEVIVACPVLCGADEIGHGVHGHNTTADAPLHHSSPGHCPDDGGDNCICQGAVRAVDVRLPEVTAAAERPLQTLPLFPTAGPRFNGLAGRGSPAGLSGWGDWLTVQAFLQVFRC